jgi:hypothetical protein
VVKLGLESMSGLVMWIDPRDRGYPVNTDAVRYCPGGTSVGSAGKLVDVSQVRPQGSHTRALPIYERCQQQWFVGVLLVLLVPDCLERCTQLGDFCVGGAKLACDILRVPT